ncbi:MAG: Hcp family type VI secretion system effector [Actinomycetota bacterium]
MALNAYLTLTGVKTGAIQGSVIEKGREGSIMVIAVSHEIISPRDPASGLPTGKRMHKPLVITKELDKSTPLLYRVLVTNETLSRWDLRYWRALPTGAQQQHFTIRLTNASIASIAQRMPNNRDPELMKLETYEEIAFTYQRIEWTWVDGGITASDDWESTVA